MEIVHATEPGSREIRNEDFVLISNGYALVLDGATAPKGVPSGCVHDVVWLVAHLATQIARLLAAFPDETLAEVLREAIVATMDSHSRTCDLENPDSPSTTVALVRWTDKDLDYLVLGDSPVVVDSRVIEDNRAAAFERATRQEVSNARNTDGGFWVASTDPAAADHALTGTVPIGEVRRVAVFTDGATRLVERYGRSWTEAMELLENEGPSGFITAVRAGDRESTRTGKRFDDATAVLLRNRS